MKKLMESWKRYLEEAEETGFPVDKEKYFGQDPEDIECIGNLRNIIFSTGRRARVDYHEEERFKGCMREAGFEFLGNGAYRIVFAFPDNDEMVLKVSRGKTSPKQNKMEASVAAGTKYGYIVPKVYEAADDYFWIKQQFVYIIKDTVGTDREILAELFPTLAEIKYWSIAEAVDKLISFIVDHGSALRNYYDAWAEMGYEQAREETQKMRWLLKSRPLVAAANMYAEFGLSTGDIRPENFGYVVDPGGKKRFVIQDFDIAGGNIS